MSDSCLMCGIGHRQQYGAPGHNLHACLNTLRPMIAALEARIAAYGELEKAARAYVAMHRPRRHTRQTEYERVTVALARLDALKEKP